MTRSFLYTFVATLAIVTSAAGQKFDTSGNGMLKGDYFIREVLITAQNMTTGTITSAASAIGVATFDGAGNYSFTGQGSNTGALGTVTNQSFKGTYQAGANGFCIIQSFVDGNDFSYGGISAIGPAAFVASATEGKSVDVLVAIPAGANVTAASLKGAYSAGYMDFLNADINMVRQASFTLNPDGTGKMGNVSVTGNAANLGGAQTTQTVTGATYTLGGAGVGTVSFGNAAAGQLLSGAKTFYTSADGNIVLAGNPGGFDLMVGIRALSAPASNATSFGLYYVAALEDFVSTGTTTTHGIDGYYGSVNANGQGTLIAHNRLQSFAFPVVDFTYDSQYTVPANGSFGDGSLYQYNLGVGGKAFVATGINGLYSLVVGFGAPQFTGPGVFLNPAGIVNAGNFAPITNPIAPNEVVTIYGTGMAPQTVFASSVPLPTTLGGVQVTFNGVAAPLFYVSNTQIVALVPQMISPANQVFNATVQVVNNNVKSNTSTVFTAASAPGVFSAGANGIGPALAQHADFTLITAANPAKIGETVVLYASGLGAVSPAVGDGGAAPSNPLAAVTGDDQVDFGGTAGAVKFAGLTPGLAGLYQLNVTVATGTATGLTFSNVSTPEAYTTEAAINIAAAATGKTVTTRTAPGRFPIGPARERKTAGVPERSR